MAAIIIWFTVSRIMAENRKETAVYRAMGAKRRDIVHIYAVYIVLIASRVVLVSAAVGIAIALAVDYFYGSMLTDMAAAAFGIIDRAPAIHLSFMPAWRSKEEIRFSLLCTSLSMTNEALFLLRSFVLNVKGLCR